LLHSFGHELFAIHVNKAVVQDKCVDA